MHQKLLNTINEDAWHDVKHAWSGGKLCHETQMLTHIEPYINPKQKSLGQKIWALDCHRVTTYSEGGILIHEGDS